MDNQERLDKLKNGDREEYKKIYRDCFRDVYKHIINNSGTFLDAEGVMQEAMMVFLKKIRTSNFLLTTSICKYLKGIVYNLWLDALKKQKTKGELGIKKLQDFQEELFLPDDTESWKFPKEKKDKMWKVLKTLSKKCQLILLNKHVYEWSFQEIAEELGTSSGTVRVDSTRCKKKFRERWEIEGIK